MESILGRSTFIGRSSWIPFSSRMDLGRASCVLVMVASFSYWLGMASIGVSDKGQ